MKKLLLFALLALAACRKDDPGPVLGREFMISPGPAIRLPETRPEPYSDEDITLTFRLLRVQDYRCHCQDTGGWARVTFELRYIDQTATDSLCIGYCADRERPGNFSLKNTDFTTITFRSKAFRVELKAIDSPEFTGKPHAATFLVR